jgi:hypothetical protein
MDRMTRIRLVLLAAAAAVSAFGLAGCDQLKANSATRPQPSASASSSPAPEDSPSSSTSPSPPKASPSNVASGKPCTSTALKLAPVPGSENGAAGSTYVQIALTNTSKAACTVKGYPAFTLTKPGDVDVPVTIDHPTNLVSPFGGAPATVTLQPGGKAVFLLGYSHVPPGPAACPVANTMHLRLPGQSTAVAGPVSIEVCGGKMHVSKFISGSALTS